MSMLKFDPNKSLIVVMQGQSNGAGRGAWTDASITGLYAAYNSSKSTTIDAKLLTSNLMIPGGTFSSDSLTDLYELGGLSSWGSSGGTDATGINMGYSFIVDLMAYLNTQSYTKNVWYLQHAYGGVKLASNDSAKDWSPSNRELIYESMNNVQDIIEYEQEVNGNDSQVIILWHQGESDSGSPETYAALLADLYAYQSKILGTPHHLFIGQLVPKNAGAIALNAAIADYCAINPNTHYVGEDLAGGVSTWEKMEADDPDATILASNPSTYTTASDQTHYNWSAQILQGKQLYDLVYSRFLV